MIVLFGQEFLVNRCAETIVHFLLNEEQRALNLKIVDGDRENLPETLHALNSFPLFSGRKVLWVKGSRVFLSKTSAKDLFQSARDAFMSGSPGDAYRFVQRMCAAAGMEDLGSDGSGITGLDERSWERHFGFARSSADQDLLDKIFTAGREMGIVWSVSQVRVDALQEALDRGFAGSNVLILTTAEADRRKKLFKALQEKALMVDCSVDSGNSRKAKEQRRALSAGQLEEHLRQADKEATPRARGRLLDLSGSDLRQLGMELEKVIAFVGDRKEITLQDVEEVVFMDREEAVYQIMDTMAGRDLASACRVLDKLWDQGFFPLAVLKVIGDELRRLLWASSRFGKTRMSYEQFQRESYPQLDETDREVVGGMAPYGVYKLLEYAGHFTREGLVKALSRTLEADIRLKTGAGDPKGVLVDLLADVCLDSNTDKQLTIR